MLSLKTDLTGFFAHVTNSFLRGLHLPTDEETFTDPAQSKNPWEMWSSSYYHPTPYSLIEMKRQTLAGIINFIKYQ